ncbi:hypothetical protein JW826_03110 [Candidatus Woesearchaeota archaeon]|nr:hypothetical protein [Candidatus Woesearchaeota archaeon]
MGKALELFWSMVLEEWRVHSTLFGNVRIGLFPALVALGSFIGCLSMLILEVMFSRAQMVLFVHFLFLFFGANIGAFGLLGREAMNRRFGQASLIAYSSRVLPISERLIFFGVVAKDVLYYFFMWILPIVAGFALATPFLGVSIALAPVLLVSLTSSFLIGTSIVYLLSVIYVRVHRFPFIFLLSLIVAAALVNKGYAYLFPPLAFLLTSDWNQVYISLGAIIVLTGIATLFVKFDFPSLRSEYRNALETVDKLLSFEGRLSSHTAKDFIDLKRSQGGFGKVIFSFLIPMAFAWIFVEFVSGMLPGVSFIVLFSILLGIFSSTVYSWLTEYDKYNQYSYLPVDVRDLLKSKLAGYCLINTLSLIMLVLAAWMKDELGRLPEAAAVFLVASFFTLSITMLYTGLSPSVRFMDAKVLVKYFLTLIPVMLAWIVSYFFGFVYMAMIGVLILAGAVFSMRRAFTKWDEGEEQAY